MAAYRGKHSRPASDSREQSEVSTSQSLQPIRRTSSSRSSSRSASTRSTRRHAAPDAFKHHEALHQTGSGSRHSKRKTLLIVIPIIAVLVVAIIGGVHLLGNFAGEEETVQAGLPVTVTIPQGASSNEIANILKENNVISSVNSFISEVQTKGVEQNLKPGTYELETLMDVDELIDLLVLGPLEDNGMRLTIPEGYTVEQTAAAVEAATGISQADFLARAYAASDYVAEYPFLEGVYNNSLEGFLYPKTYSVPEDANADYVVRMLLDQFALETSNLDISYAESKGMNLYYVVVMASLIEKETAADDERPLVASVIYNRLHEGMRLQIDATVVYALGPDFSGEVLYEDLEIDSPYNTYKVDELPAGPICSPSIASIEAAAHPAETNYYYYVLTSKEGYHTFCETSEEFEAAKAEYNRIFGIE